MRYSYLYAIALAGPVLSAALFSNAQFNNNQVQPWRLNTSGGQTFIVPLNNGYFVGIGTSTPSKYLSVHGDAMMGGLYASSTVQFRSLNCTTNSNGGALTANADGIISCTDDDSTGGSGT